MELKHEYAMAICLGVKNQTYRGMRRIRDENSKETNVFVPLCFPRAKKSLMRRFNGHPLRA